MKEFVKRLSNLLTIKSVVTLVLTFVFAYMAVVGLVSAEVLMTIYATVIAFYFGTQAKKDN